MAGGISGDAAVFLEGDSRAVSRRAVDTLKSLSAASLKSLASATASEMAGSHTQSSSTTATECSADYEAFAVMSAIVATFARDGGARSSAEQRYKAFARANRQQLYALGVEDEGLQAKLMCALAAVVPSVERVLENTSFDFAHVVDVNWRLDYVLRSSSSGSIREPLYFVQVKLQSPSARASGLQTVAFSCSVEELRSLVYRIQEAANEVEKLAAGTPSQLRTSM